MKFETTAEHGETQQYEGRKPVKIRIGLTDREAHALRELWGGIESRCGLGSSYGSSVERYLSAISYERQREPESGYMPVHESRHVNIGRQCRCVNSNCACPVQLYEVERMSCWTKIKEGSIGGDVKLAYRTLMVMAEREQSGFIGLIYRQYSGGIPLERYTLYASLGLGDVAALAQDAPSVTRRASVMTRERRLADRGAATVSELEALDHMLVRKSGDTKQKDSAREALARTIKTECEAMLAEASGAYMSAKDEAALDMVRPWAREDWR